MQDEYLAERDTLLLSKNVEEKRMVQGGVEILGIHFLAPENRQIYNVYKGH